MKADRVAPGDSAEITALLDRAFSPSTFESLLMLSLRGSGREVLEWVIRSNGRIAAHIAFTRAYRERSAIGFHLAPVAVQPDLQRRGFGTALISETLVAPGIATAPVFVVGDPKYYVRFGFERAANPICPFDPDNQHFQALRWVSDDVFTIGYEPEFHNA